MKVLGCKMRRDRAEAFQAACKARGTTANAVFMAAAEAFLRDFGEGSSQGARGDEGGRDQGQ